MVSGRRGRRQIYWDSCVWLNYINSTPTHKPVLDALLADSVSPVGDIQLVTSAIAVVEVAFAASEQQNRALDSEVEASIDGLWYDPRRPVTLVDFYSQIAIEARSLMRDANVQMGLKLTSLDAIHLATASRMNVTEFHTYDKDLPRFSGTVGFPIIEPYVGGGPLAQQTPLFGDNDSDDDE